MIPLKRRMKWTFLYVFIFGLLAALYQRNSIYHYTEYSDRSNTEMLSQDLRSKLSNQVIDESFHLEFTNQNDFSKFGASLIDLPNCKIPNLDPYDTSIKSFLRNGQPITCNRYPPITYENGSKLEVNWVAINDSFLKDRFSHCKYQVIYRPRHADNHDYFTLLEESPEFNSTVYINHDFIRVQCYNKAFGKIYTNFHQFIHRKNEIEERCVKDYSKHLKNKKTSENLNILMLGVDSVSRLNFHRYFRKTKTFLLHELGAIEMNGYNKVADNTFVNIVPMTTGKFVEELPWNETMNKMPFDHFTFIWDEFAKRGYRTLYAEDAPNIAIFDYLKAGFRTQPTDYFNRHFSIAMERDSYAWYSDHHCLTDRLETEIVLQYVYQFVSEFKIDPHFAFAFLTRLTHDSLEKSASADIPYRNFFSNLHKNKLTENTVIIFYSDHGIRFGDFRKTYSGKLEERLPFMFIIFPTWFLKKYPEIAANLRQNSFRLSTPFDVYATLKNILDFDGKIKTAPKKLRNVSLFSEISQDRSCDDAGILPHWCTCAKQQQLQTNDQLVLRLAKYLLVEINRNIFEHSDKCEKLYVKEIDTAVKLLSSEKILRFVDSKNDVIDRKVYFGNRTLSLVDYQLTVRTTPGNALFEATIRYDETQHLYRIIGDISRINLYANQSDCIDVSNLKKFCFCKNLTG